MDIPKRSFEEFLVNQKVEIALLDFSINLVITAFLAWFLRMFYVKFGHSLSNRRSFSGNFVLVAVTTMLIITIVKSSLALSLGLVGALSIVRFRTAIKEPEELSFIFMNIAIGLGLGAGQRAVTMIGFTFLVILIALRKFGRKDADSQNLYLTLGAGSDCKVDMKTVTDVLEKYCQKIDLRRFDEGKDRIEIAYQIEFEGFEEFADAKDALKEAYPFLEISFLDSHLGLT